MRARVKMAAVVLAVAFLVAGCETEVDFQNPLDPLSGAFLAVPRDAVVVDDFNDGNDARNLLNHCPDRFVDPLGTARIDYRYVAEDALRGVGYSLRIDFDLQAAGDPFGGYVVVLTDSNLCPSARGPFNLEGLNLTVLSFWVKTSSPTVDFEVALKDLDDGQTDPKQMMRGHMVGGNGSAWTRVRIPVTRLTPSQRGSPLNLQRLREVNIGFARQRFTIERAALTGTVTLDDIAFER